jgi:dephospho-CoA kinase
MSRIRLHPYRPEWPAEAQGMIQRMARVLGDRALRIRHIGSTAVPGLVAKDVLDLQVELRLPEGFAFGEGETENEAVPPLLTEALDAACSVLEARLPLERIQSIDADHIPIGSRERDPAHWCKAFLQASPGRRKAHVHLRFDGAANARFAVLIRDYLRAQPYAAQAYAAFKERLAEGLADPADYPIVKDPVADLMALAARNWAERKPSAGNRAAGSA